MSWKNAGVVAAVMLSAAASMATAAAAAEAPHWQVTALPLPSDLPAASGSVVAHDGHGGYTGILTTPTGDDIVTWKNGQVTEHGVPAGHNDVRVLGETADDTVLVWTVDGKLFTLDGNGFHAVATGRYAFVDNAAFGPRGEIVATAQNPDAAGTIVVRWSPTDPAGFRPLAGALPNSSTRAVDDDGSVLLSDATGPYVLRHGVAQRLSPAPAPWMSDAYTIKHGVVVGAAYLGAPGYAEAITWSAPGYDARILDGGEAALGIGAHGVVAGIATGDQPAVWVNHSAVTDLPLPDGATAGQARFVDNDGAVAGTVHGADVNRPQPVLWQQVR